MSPVNKKLIANFSVDPEKTVNKIFHYDFCYFVKNGRGSQRNFLTKKKEIVVVSHLIRQAGKN